MSQEPVVENPIPEPAPEALTDIAPGDAVTGDAVPSEEPSEPTSGGGGSW